MPTRIEDAPDRIRRLHDRLGRGAWTPDAADRSLAADVLASEGRGRPLRDAVVAGLRADAASQLQPADDPLRPVLISAARHGSPAARDALLNLLREVEGRPPEPVGVRV
ncbi:hypothetical protein [Streptomyces sp. NPDC060194]|uniref:hypothetical protein n=1 Tax=Streptomyces sp. NPDC060194 TaxID=3347069 RepID=UPI0036677D2E